MKRRNGKKGGGRERGRKGKKRKKRERRVKP